MARKIKDFIIVGIGLCICLFLSGGFIYAGFQHGMVKEWMEALNLCLVSIIPILTSCFCAWGLKEIIKVDA